MRDTGSNSLRELENRWARKGPGGSNPSPSATNLRKLRSDATTLLAARDAGSERIEFTLTGDLAAPSMILSERFVQYLKPPCDVPVTKHEAEPCVFVALAVTHSNMAVSTANPCCRQVSDLLLFEMPVA